MANNLLLLQQELLLDIFLFLDISDIPKVALTCSKFNSLCNDKFLWKHFCYEKWIELVYYEKEERNYLIEFNYRNTFNEAHKNLGSEHHWKQTYKEYQLLNKYAYEFGYNSGLVNAGDLYSEDLKLHSTPILYTNNRKEFSTAIFLPLGRGYFIRSSWDCYEYSEFSVKYGGEWRPEILNSNVFYILRYKWKFEDNYGYFDGYGEPSSHKYTTNTLDSVEKITLNTGLKWESSKSNTLNVLFSNNCLVKK